MKAYLVTLLLILLPLTGAGCETNPVGGESTVTMYVSPNALDPLMVRLEASSGERMDFYGTRNTDGTVESFTRVVSTKSDGSSITLLVDEGLVWRVLLDDGIQYGLNYSEDKMVVTKYGANGMAISNQEFPPLTEPAARVKPLHYLELASDKIRFEISVTDCNGDPLTDLEGRVKLEIGTDNLFGEPWVGYPRLQGTTYVAEIPILEDKLQSTCEMLDNDRFEAVKWIACLILGLIPEAGPGATIFCLAAEEFPCEILVTLYEHNALFPYAMGMSIVPVTATATIAGCGMQPEERSSDLKIDLKNPGGYSIKIDGCTRSRHQVYTVVASLFDDNLVCGTNYNPNDTCPPLTGEQMKQSDSEGHCSRPNYEADDPPQFIDETMNSSMYVRRYSENDCQQQFSLETVTRHELTLRQVRELTEAEAAYIASHPDECIGMHHLRASSLTGTHVVTMKQGQQIRIDAWITPNGSSPDSTGAYVKIDILAPGYLGKSIEVCYGTFGENRCTIGPEPRQLYIPFSSVFAVLPPGTADDTYIQVGFVVSAHTTITANSLGVVASTPEIGYQFTVE